MSKRIPYKLDQLGSVGRGRSRHRPRDDASLYGGPYPFFQTGDVKAAEFYLHDYSQTYSEKGLTQSKLWQPGTLCITIAANIAETSILSIAGCFPDSVVGFVADQDIADTAFVKYYLDTIKISMQNISKGTTQDNLSLDKLLSFDLLTPPLPTQRRIASILSAYDDLIENNTRRIAILEEMARRLYEEWFVNFRFPGHEKARFVETELGLVPEGWEVGTLGSIAVINPESVKLSSAPNTIEYIDISSVSTGQISQVTPMLFVDAPSRARRIVKSTDILWSCVRPNLKAYALIINPAPNTVASTGFAVIRAQNAPYSYIYNLVTSDLFVTYLVNHATGAAYPAVKPSDFEAAKILLPRKRLLDKFHEKVEPMMLLCSELKRKNANLRAQRDLLLPRLISGELDVSEAEEIVEGAAV